MRRVPVDNEPAARRNRSSRRHDGDAAERGTLGFAGGADAGTASALLRRRGACRPAQRRRVRRAGLLSRRSRWPWVIAVRLLRDRTAAGIAFPAASSSSCRRLRAACRRRRRLSQRCLPVHLAECLGRRRIVRRAALPVLRGRRVVPPCEFARRVPLRSTGSTARHAAGSSSSGGRGETRRTTRRAIGCGSSRRLGARGAARGRERDARPQRACDRASRSRASSRACATGPVAAWGEARGPGDRRVRRRLHAERAGSGGSAMACATRCRRPTSR